MSAKISHFRSTLPDIARQRVGRPARFAATSVPGTFRTCQVGLTMSAHRGIVLQNSKVAAVQIFGENLKRKEVDNSHSFSRATEVAHEFGARR